MLGKKFDLSDLGRTRRGAEANINQALIELGRQNEEYLMELRDSFVLRLRLAGLEHFVEMSILKYFDAVMVQKFAAEYSIEEGVKKIDELLSQYDENSYHHAVILNFKACHIAKLNDPAWGEILQYLTQAKQIFTTLYTEAKFTHVRVNMINCAYSMANIYWQLAENGTIDN